MPEVLPVEKIKERVGQEIAVSDWLEITQDRINQFANCILDYQFESNNG